MATDLKQGVRYSTHDWFTNNYAVSTNSERSRQSSFGVRQDAAFMRNDTNIKTRWDQHDNNTRLSDRIEDIRKWKDIMEDCLNRINREIALLTEAKDTTEAELAALEIPLEVANENLTMRDSRKGIDLVRDDVERELRKEVEVIEGAKRLLQERCKQAFDQLLVLQEARQEVLRDLRDKAVALGIDVDQYNLTEDMAPGGLSFKPDPCRIAPGTTTPQQWEDYSRYNRDRADAEIGASQRLREAMTHSLAKAANDIAAQRNAVDYALRRRIHEQERARGELEWQRQNLEGEIARLEAECRALEDAIRDKINPLKLAMTRAENRQERPGIELCYDDPQMGLCAEISELKGTMSALEQKLKEARHALQNLENNLHRVNEELALKNASITLDKRSQDVRNSRLRPSCQPTAASDATHGGLSAAQKNLCYTGIERERTKILGC